MITPEHYLHTTNRERSKSPLVEGAAKVAERKGVRMGNAEAKIGAFISRIGDIEHQLGVKERLLDMLVESMVIQEQDIPEAYWERQKQLARDNGVGDFELDDALKANLTEQLQDAQRTSIESWVDYLNQTGDQYPTWFKIFTMEGIARLGVFDKEKGQYRTRSKGTVAPYPPLNPSALAATYDSIHDHLRGDGLQTEDVPVTKLVENGNFNKLYSHYLLETNTAIPTPERAEDVHGEWRRYTHEDIRGLTLAAQGTPWCIAGRKVAEHYTKDGYFYLFHLQDVATGQYSQTASASIRMQHGGVVEISGLKGGSDQYLEDALVPTVQEKVALLPGGERYLRAFQDKQTLICMDRKFQAEPREPFTLDELRFLFELDRSIEYINTNTGDSRVEEFKGDSEVYAQLERDLGPNVARVAATDKTEMSSRLDEFLSWTNPPIELIVNKLDTGTAIANFNKLIAAGADIEIDELFDKLEPYEIEWYLKTLMRVGADPLSIIAKVKPHVVAHNIEEFLATGSKIDINILLDKLGPAWVTGDVLKKLIDAGADRDKLSAIFGDLHSEDTLYRLKELVSAGIKVNVDAIVTRLPVNLLLGHIDELVAAGANVDVNELLMRMSSSEVEVAKKRLLAAGADPKLVASRLGEGEDGDLADWEKELLLQQDT